MAVRARSAIPGPSLWQAMAPPLLPRPALSGVEEAEVAIVGGGIAGLSLALYLAEAGNRPLLLEAGVPGDGALGASAGIIAPQLVRDTPSGLLARLGNDLGRSWLEIVAESGGHLFDLIAREGIECDPRPYGFLAPAARPSGAAWLHRCVEEWRPFRSDLTVLNRAEVETITGCRGYAAAVLDRSGGALDPLRLARGLADRTEAKGGRIFHHSKVTSLERAETHWRLQTASGGTVQARQVILCANGGNAALHPTLAQTVMPMRIYEMATEPLSLSMQAEVLPHGHCMTDLELDIFSIRYAADGRLVTAYPVSRHQSISEVEAQVNARLRRTLVNYRPIAIERLWEGVAWINSGLVPRLVRVDEGLTAVQACNGRGIATNAIVGRELARMILSEGRYQPALACALPPPISGFALAQMLPNMMMSAALRLRRLGASISRRR